MLQKIVGSKQFLTLTGVALFALPLLASTPDEAADVDRPSAWEKICLDGGATAACDKASSILSDKLVDTEDLKKEETFRERLLRVSRRGCATGHLTSCAELIGVDDGQENLKRALGVAKKNCTSHPDPSGPGCKYMSEWQSGADDAKNEVKAKPPIDL